MVRKLLAVSILAAFLAYTGTAGASLVTDTNAMGGQWQGSKTFSYTGNLLKVDVAYAVYAPGQFALSFPGQDPSGGTKYIYAYQVLNTIYSESSYVNRLSVGLTTPGIEASDIGYIAGGGIDPNNVSPNPAYGFDTATAGWNFKDPTINYGQTSDILYFASSSGPGWDAGTAGGQYRKTLTLPSPVPEPATLSLLGIGMIAAIWRRRSESK